ncbi:MAG: TIM-barrel domain-containing protein [Steroidobacteraceae bacterium]
MARGAVATLAAVFAAGLAGPVPAQSPSAVTVDHARFEFLTASLVRLEYSPAGTFVDAPTAVVMKRDWPAVRVQSTRKDGWLTATSGSLIVRYRLGSGEFTATNLEVTWKDEAGALRAWRPGATDPLNLGGLTYSLDNISAANLPAEPQGSESPVNDEIPGLDMRLAAAKPGLLSRAGYALIDDSETPVWNARHTWIEPRPLRHGQDWYLFAYGRDYHRVLNEYAALCGPVPMIPRFALGAWITDLNFEYFPGSAEAALPAFRRYNQQHLEQEVARLRGSGIPFDTLVLDFAWHNYGWDGGYDWSPLIPQPALFLSWLKARGVKVALNDHPGYINTGESILSYSDSHAPQVLKDLGRPLPPQPSFDLDVSKLWTFAADADDRGLKERWYAPGQGGVRWRPVRIGLPWEAQGHANDRGVGWYRASVAMPAKLPAALYLYLGEVEKSYRLFVNGTEAGHSEPHWPQRLSVTDLTRHLLPGRQNEIVLRIEPGERGSGIVRGPAAIRDVPAPPRIAFDLSNERQAEVFMRDLHEPLMHQGVAVWWVDGGSGAVDMPGLNKQLWTNKVFYDYSEQLTGRRGLILARYGDWGSERYPAYFTGDTYSQWPVLAYEIGFTARGGNVLVPYITHDIGGFHGGRIDFDLYARWIEFGAFSPLLRMHSDHENPHGGNLRMPWVYGPRGIALMRKYFTLRTQLIPYLYTYVWRAHAESLPILRPLYLEYPDLEAAYRHPHEYFVGDEMLVAPVVDPSGNDTIYLPPGEWVDFFTGKHYAGDRTFTAHYAVDETPVFVREGALIPEQPVSAWSDAQPLDTLIVNVYGSGAGRFDLYEDDGISLAYREGKFARTALTYATGSDGWHRLSIEPARGTFAGQVTARAYELRIHGSGRPSAVSVDGREVRDWRWDAGQATAVVPVVRTSIAERVSVAWR